MPLGIAGAAHTEIALSLDILYQLGGVVVVVGGGAPLGDVPPKGQHVLNPPGLQLLQNLCYVLSGRGGAGQVGQHVHPILVLDAGGDAHGIVAGAAASAVGDAHEIGPQGGDLLGGFGHGLVGVAGFGGEHLKREGNLVLFELVNDLHGKHSLYRG